MNVPVATICSQSVSTPPRSRRTSAPVGLRQLGHLGDPGAQLGVRRGRSPRGCIDGRVLAHGYWSSLGLRGGTCRGAAGAVRRTHRVNQPRMATARARRGGGATHAGSPSAGSASVRAAREHERDDGQDNVDADVSGEMGAVPEDDRRCPDRAQQAQAQEDQRARQTGAAANGSGTVGGAPAAATNSVPWRVSGVVAFRGPCARSHPYNLSAF